MRNKTILEFNNISFRYTDKEIFNSISGSVLAFDKIGLVGINGSGKSTLLKLLYGKIKPLSGYINSNGTLAYSKQIDLEIYKSELSLIDYLQSLNNDWWNISFKYKELFEEELDLEIKVNLLSGGEIAKINLVACLIKNPDLLLLDEPTNHLDLDSLNLLEKVLFNLKIPFIVVSHNVNFLNNVVNKIWEIENQKINVFGGNYSFYKLEKEKIYLNLIEKVEVENKKIKKEKIKLQKKNIEFQKKSSKLKRLAKANDRSMPKIIRNTLKLRGQEIFSKSKNKLEKIIEDSKDKIVDIGLKKEKRIKLKLENNLKKGLLIRISNSKLSFSEDNVLINFINFNIYRGDKIAILGKNASGKSSFVKELSFNATKNLKGSIKYGLEYKTEFVDQKYSFIDRNLTLEQNIKKSNLNLNFEEIRKKIRDLGFLDDLDFKKKATELSGGEIAKLSFAMLSNSQIDLLILDEPTNNLDIVTKEEISNVLKDYRGSLVLISHDLEFIESIKIKKIFLIENKRLKEVDLEKLKIL